MAELTAMRARGETGTLPDAPGYPVDEAFWTAARVVTPHRRRPRLSRIIRPCPACENMLS